MIKTKLLFGFLCFFPFLPVRATNVVNQLGDFSIVILISLSFVVAVVLIWIASKKCFDRWGKNARHDEVIAFQWPSRNKKYESFTQFMNEVEHWNHEWGLDFKWIKTYETPRILMRFDEQLNGRPVKLEIEVIPDNRRTIRTDEWMFKLQNGLVPYLDILEGHTSPYLIIPKKWRPGKEMICKLFLGVYEEDSDYVMTDIAWKFTDVAYTDYQDFIKEVQAFQTEHNKPLWNPDHLLIEQALFTFCYNDVRTKQDELVLMKADNGIGFTEGEILFKLHNRMINILPGQEFCYFRYLVLRRDGGEFDGDENCIYDLHTKNELW